MMPPKLFFENCVFFEYFHCICKEHYSHHSEIFQVWTAVVFTAISRSLVSMRARANERVRASLSGFFIVWNKCGHDFTKICGHCRKTIGYFRESNCSLAPCVSPIHPPCVLRMIFCSCMHNNFILLRRYWSL